jgi:hypothetical protein
VRDCWLWSCVFCFVLMATYHTTLCAETHTQKSECGGGFMSAIMLWCDLASLSLARSRFPVTPRLNSAKNVYAHINKSRARGTLGASRRHTSRMKIYFLRDARTLPPLCLAAWKLISFKRNSKAEKCNVLMCYFKRKRKGKTAQSAFLSICGS